MNLRKTLTVGGLIGGLSGAVLTANAAKCGHDDELDTKPDAGIVDRKICNHVPFDYKAPNPSGGHIFLICAPAHQAVIDVLETLESDGCPINEPLKKIDVTLVGLEEDAKGIWCKGIFSFERGPSKTSTTTRDIPIHTYELSNGNRSYSYMPVNALPSKELELLHTISL